MIKLVKFICKIIYIFLFLIFASNTYAQLQTFNYDQSYNFSIYTPIYNQYFTVWGDCRNIAAPYTCAYGSTNNSDIYGQIIKSNGTCNGSNIQIAGASTGQELPAVAYNPDNQEYLVIWQGLKRDYLAGINTEGEFQKNGFDIFGQRISAVTGQKIGRSFTIAPSPDLPPLSPCYSHPNEGLPCDDNQWHPRIAYSTKSHRYMVVWHDGRMRARFMGSGFSADVNDRTTFKDIYGQILGQDGSLIGNNFPVSLDPGNLTKEYHGNAIRIQQYADITYDDKADRFFVAWEDDRLTGDPADSHTANPHPPLPCYDCLNFNIWGGFFTVDGQPQGNNFLISKLAEAERYPRVAYNFVTDNFLVVWQSAPLPPSGECTYPSCDGVYQGNTQMRKVWAARIYANGEVDSNLSSIDNAVQQHTTYMEDTEPPRAGVTVNQSTGQYLITWEKNNHLQGRWYKQDGTLTSTSNLGLGSPYNYVTFNQESQQYFVSYVLNQQGKPNVVFRTQTQTAPFNCPASGSGPSTPPLATITSCSTCPTITNQPSSIPEQPTLPPTHLKAATIRFKAKTGSSGNVTINFRALPQSLIVEKTTAADILGTVRKLDFIISGIGPSATGPQPTGPTEPPPSGTPIVTLKIKFRSVSEDKGAQVVKVRVFKGGLFKKEFPGVFAEFKDGAYTIENLTLLGIAPGKNFRLFVKGPKHLSHGFDPVELKDGNNTFDLTSEELEPGDLPPQDGVINSLDISRLIELLEVNNASKEQLMTADLNYDNIINGADVNEMLVTLQERYDEDKY